jgi:hypothetical protein
VGLLGGSRRTRRRSLRRRGVFPRRVAPRRPQPSRARCNRHRPRRHSRWCDMNGVVRNQARQCSPLPRCGGQGQWGRSPRYRASLPRTDPAHEAAARLVAGSRTTGQDSLAGHRESACSLSYADRRRSTRAPRKAPPSSGPIRASNRRTARSAEPRHRRARGTAPGSSRPARAT